MGIIVLDTNDMWPQWRRRNKTHLQMELNKTNKLFAKPKMQSKTTRHLFPILPHRSESRRSRNVEIISLEHRDPPDRCQTPISKWHRGTASNPGDSACPAALQVAFEAFPPISKTKWAQGRRSQSPLVDEAGNIFPADFHFQQECNWETLPVDKWKRNCYILPGLHDNIRNNRIHQGRSALCAAFTLANTMSRATSMECMSI